MTVNDPSILTISYDIGLTSMMVSGLAFTKLAFFYDRKAELRVQGPGISWLVAGCGIRSLGLSVKSSVYGLDVGRILAGVACGLLSRCDVALLNAELALVNGAGDNV